MTEDSPYYGVAVSARALELYEYGPEQTVPTQLYERPWGRLAVAVLQPGPPVALVAELADGFVPLVESGDVPTITVRDLVESEGAAVIVRLGQTWYKARTAIYLDKQPGETDADVLERLHIDEEHLLAF